MKKVNRRKMDDSAANNVWRSYSDMMSGLLLLFILIMAVCLMQAQKNYTEKLAEQAKLLQSQSDLAESQSQVSEQQAQLSAQATTLAEQESELAAQESTLAEQAASLEELQALLESQKLRLAQKEAEVDEKNTLLTQKESELENSQTALDEANALMASQQERIDKIIGVKADLIEDLNDEFKANQINVQIDTQTGAILLDSSVLFEFSESDLTDPGQMILDDILPVYCSVLLSKDYVDYVGEIIIEGYTDSVGDFASNLSLSQNRAYAVAEYLLSNMDSFLSEEERNTLLSKITANGRSSSNPILNEDGTENAEASRRVEVKFRLKDEEMLTELQNLIEESRGQTQPAGT
jgi:chemotaxis protein MotB